MASAPPAERSGAFSPASTSKRLAPYVPRLAIDWLRETPEERYKQVEGTLVFVDISGFTNLTERLSRKGKVGGEEMNQILNACFTEFLSTAYDFGAGVIKWGGDAVLLLFTADAHEARACRAAFEMQSVMRRVGRIKTGSTSVTLRMSVGIHSGAIDFFLIGGLHRELVVTGPAASQTVAMESMADAGEIALSPATAQALPISCVGVAAKRKAMLLRSGPDVVAWRSSAVEDVEDVDVAQCLPVDIRQHLAAGGGEPEHRPMTAAFIHFMGVDDLLEREAPTVVADALEETLSTVEEIAHAHQVAFFDTDIYSSGGKIMLMAGAPRSTGADEERMLRAMRAVMDADLPLTMRIGVNRGRIFVGDFGPDYRRTYTVTGDAVNLAARLMAKAEPGEIVATDDILSRSRTAFQTVALEPFQAKGKSEPVYAFLVDGIHAREERADAAPLVGRNHELEVLLDAFASASVYSGKLVEVVAEPGMGKSRLIEELRVRATPVHARSAQCDEYEVASPYFAFRGVMRALLELDADAGPDELRRSVETSATHLLPYLPLIGVPLGIEIPDTPETELLEDRFRKSRLEETIRELFGILLLQPALLIFEDAHWMDEASADLLRALVLGLEERPWLVVVTRRGVAGGFTAPEDADPIVLELEPLGAEQAAELVHAATEDLPLPPHEVAKLAERAGGNPLFLTELLAAARSGGLDEIPDSVEALMLSEIDRLPPADRRVLRCAAVVGATFTEDLVVASLEEPPDPGVWRRLAEYLDEQPDGQLRFRHALVRDAAYEGLPYRRRRELHQRVGETIERASAQPEDDSELLSLHFFHAHDFTKAWNYSRIAGARAAAIYANVEAASFFERALAAGRHRRDVSVEERARVLEELGDLRVRLGEFEKAWEAYRASIRRLRSDPVEATRVIMKQAQVPSWLGNYPQALRWISRGLSGLAGVAGTGAAVERARLYALYGAFRIRQGRSRDAITWCQRAVEEGEPVGAREALAHAYLVLDEAYSSLGRFDEAVYSPLALALYEELGDVHRLALVLNNMGMFAHFQGRWDEALDLYGRAREAWAKIGSWHGSLATLNLGEVLADQGHVDEAEALLRDALRVAKASHSASRVAEVALILGRLLSRTGRFEEAHALFAISPEEYAGEADARTAECLMLEGQAAEALALSTSALERRKSLESGLHLKVMQLRTQGCSLLQLDRLEEARAALVAALEEARKRSLAYEVALTLDALSLLARLIDEPAAELEEERDVILGRLGVMRIPETPVPKLAAKTL